MLQTIALVLLILSEFGISIAKETEVKSIYDGEIFELRCSTNHHYPVVWHFCQSNVTHEIFLGGEISMAFKNMFLLKGNQSVGEYNLLIPSADDRYAGNYKCIDDEGFGSELISIQLNVTDLTSTAHMAPITEHAPDAINQEAPKVAAIRSQISTHSRGFAYTGVVCGIVVSVVFVVSIIIAIAARKWRPTCKGNQSRSASHLSIDAEAQPQSKPHSVEPLTRTPIEFPLDSSDSSTSSFANSCTSLVKEGGNDAEKRDSLSPPKVARQCSITSVGSDSSTTPLLPPIKE